MTKANQAYRRDDLYSLGGSSTSVSLYSDGFGNSRTPFILEELLNEHERSCHDPCEISCKASD